MKQTNNAIKFLVAQYRAIFKNAYLKGLASAAVLTAALAAGQAQAHAYTSVDGINSDPDKTTVTIGKDDIFHLNNAGSADPDRDGSIFDKAAIINKDIVFDGNSGGAFFGASGGDLYIQSENKLTLKNGSSLYIGTTSPSTNALDVRFGEIEVQSGTALNVHAGSGSGKFTRAHAGTLTIKGTTIINNVTSGNAFLTGDVINITGSDAKVIVGAANLDDTAKSRAVLGWRGEKLEDSVSYSGSVITIGNEAELILKGSSKEDDGSYGAQVWGNSFTLKNKSKLFVQKSGAAIVVEKAAFENSFVDVADGSTLLFKAKGIQDVTNEKPDGNGSLKLDKQKTYSGVAGTVSISNSIVDLNNLGNLMLTRGGTLSIDDASFITGGKISVHNEHNTLDYTGTTQSTLSISSTALDKYLNSDLETAKDSSGNAITDIKGQLRLSQGGRVNFTDTQTVDMTKFTFTNQVTGEVGKIIASPEATLKSFDDYLDDNKEVHADVRFVAKDMSISDDLSKGDASSTSHNANFEADVLTVGGAKFSSSTKSLGINQAIVHEQVRFVASEGDKTNTFTAQDEFIYDAPYFTKGENPCDPWALASGGKITDANLVISDDGLFKVVGGTWENEGQSITLKQVTTSVNEYSLEINAQAGTKSDSTSKYLIDTTPASLTWNGEFNIDGTSDVGVIKIQAAKGANATLDLTGATVTWGSGVINVFGVATDSDLGFNASNVINDDWNTKQGYGVLKIKNTQLKDLLTTGSTSQVNLITNGVLFVDGSDNTIDFGKLQNVVSSANASDGHISFSQGQEGILYHTGTIHLETGVDRSGSEPVYLENGGQLDIGNGRIYATDIDITNYAKDAYQAKELTSDYAHVKAGILAVAKTLRTDNRKLVFGEASSTKDANLVLGFDSDVLSDKAGGSVFGDLEFNHNSKLTVANGSWHVSGVNQGDITLNDSSSIEVSAGAFADTGLKSSLVADNLNITGAGSISVDADAEAQFETVQATNDATINVSGHLIFTGKEVSDPAADAIEVDPAFAAKSTNGIDLSGVNLITVDRAGAVLEFKELATKGLLDTSTADLKINPNGLPEAANWDVTDFGQVKFNFAENTLLDAKDVQVLVDGILDTDTTGYLNLANANLGITSFTERANGYYNATWEKDVENFKQVVGHATTDQLLNTVIQVADDQSKVRGHYAALEVTDKNNNSYDTITLDGPTSLHHSDANGGNFVSFNGNVGNVNLNSDAGLALFGSGTIGSITGTRNTGGDIIDENGKVVEDGLNSLYISNEIAEGETTTSQVTIAGAVKNINEFGISTGAQVSVNDSATNIGYVGLFDNSSLTVTHDLQSDGLEVEAGSSVKAENTKFIDGLVMGKSNTTDTLTLGDKQYGYGELLIYGGEVVTKNLTLANNSHNTSYGVEVGTGIEDKDFDDPESLYNEQIGYAGTLEVRGKTILNKGWLNVLAEDTQADKGVSFASLNELSGTANATNAFAGTLDGDLLVGLHGVTGVGVKDMATLKSELSRFYDGTNLTTDAQSILYLGQAFTIGEDQSVILTSQKYKDFLGYVRETNTKRTDKQNIKLDVKCANDLLSNHVLYMGEGSLIVVDDAVAKKAEITGLEGVTAQAMLNFAGQDGTVIADGGDMFINGNVRTNVDYQVFGNAKIEYLDGTAYKVALEGEANEDKNINVSTKNNFLNGVVDEQGILSLNIDKHARGIMAGASDPVYDTIVAYARGYYGPEVTKPQTPADGAETKAVNTTPVEPEYIYTLDADGNKVYQYENHFISETINTGDGSAVETVARLGVFGGMSQTAIAVAGTSSDAMAARMGIGGKNTQLSVADNGQGASLWVAPIYKSYNSDTFAIQSLNYGVDIDMYGLALGGDYSLGNGMKFGAMFNLGSGDTEGNGAATGTTNDFNYYGFGAFFGYSIDQFSVMADASYTIVDNDLEANTAIEKVSSSADASTYSIGVTAQYTIDMAGFEIAPHIGARYSSIDLDDYIIKGASGDIALYEAEKINVFSIPVGVSFAKEIVSESWTVKPSLDLTVTVNAGDDTADGNVYWAGAENLRTTGLKSEILDSVTYGATAGFSAKSGNFSLGLGVSYTGSSNTDELGVNANARFMF